MAVSKNGTKSQGEGAAVIAAAGGGPVALPQGFSLVDASFSREGADLVLSAPDGRQVIVSGFFSGESPSLVGADGTQIPGHIAGMLAGPRAPGQVAAAEAEALGGEPIGEVSTVSGRVFVNRADGTRVEAEFDQPLYKGDVLETEEDGAIGVLLADETTFAMSGDGRIALAEMSYDPGSQEGTLSLFAVKGVFTFVSGLVSKTDPEGMTVDTPVATIGIRGTQLGVEFADGRNLTTVMMREADGFVGEIVVTSPGGTLVMNQAHQSALVGFDAPAPEFLPPVDDSVVVRMFETALLHLPLVHGQENDYGTQEGEGGSELEEFTTQAGDGEEEPALEETIRVVGEGDALPPRPPVVDVVSPVVPPPAAPEPAEAPVEDADPPRVEDFGVVTDYDPVAFDETATILEDQAFSGQLQATDPDNDALSFAVAEGGAPGSGSVVLNPDGTYTYTPDPDFHGTDSFTYVVSDGRGGTTTATVTVEVTAVPDVPFITAEPASGAEDTAIPLTVSAEVLGLEGLASVTVAGVPAGGQLSAGTDNGDGTWTLQPDELDGLNITPPPDYNVDIDLTVEAVSTDGGMAIASVLVEVSAVAEAPHLEVSDTGGGVPPGDDQVIKGSGGGGRRARRRRRRRYHPRRRRRRRDPR